MNIPLILLAAIDNNDKVALLINDQKYQVFSDLALDNNIATGHPVEDYFIPSIRGHDRVYVVGTASLYQFVLDKYSYLIRKVLISRTDREGTYGAFPLDHPSLLGLGRSFIGKELSITQGPHEEYQYLNILREAYEQDVREDRTGTGTRSIFGRTMIFDLRKGLPIITTKKIAYSTIIKELLFFISGRTDSKYLEEKGVTIWSANTSEEVLRKNNLPWREGDMGPSYGFQWRHWGLSYEGCDKNYEGGVDQLAQVIEGIKNNPMSRRHILSAWNVSDIPSMVLPPCHCLCQFYVSTDRRFLDLQLYQRSGDLFLGVPFNITSYALLLELVSKLCGLQARFFYHVLGDAHVYIDHLSLAAEQLSRIPYPFPRVQVESIEKIEDITCKKIKILDYKSWGILKAKMSV